MTALRLLAPGLLGLLLCACGDPADGQGLNLASGDIAAALDVCERGQGAFARGVCANEELVQLDHAVRDVLVAEAGAVSSAGAELLVRNQTRWREAQRIACGIGEAAPDAAQAQCLKNRMRARIGEARSVVQEMGGYTFQRMELVEAVAAAPDSAGAAAIVRDIRFPRIDGPQTPEVRAFNDLVAQEPQFRLQDGANETLDYVIEYAGANLISVSFTHSSDRGDGAAPATTARALNVLLAQRRTLTESDLFRADSGWRDFITDRAVRHISRQFSDYPDFPPRRDVFETATKPHLWVIGERGLTLLFPPLSFGGSHADGDVKVTIRWDDLRPYLNPEAPAPINPAE